MLLNEGSACPRLLCKPGRSPAPGRIPPPGERPPGQVRLGRRPVPRRTGRLSVSSRDQPPALRGFTLLRGVPRCRPACEQAPPLEQGPLPVGAARSVMKLTWLPGRLAAGGRAVDQFGSLAESWSGRRAPISCWCPAQLGLPACDNRETGRRRRPARALLTLLAPTVPPRRPHTALAPGRLLRLVPQEPALRERSVWELGACGGFLCCASLGNALLRRQAQADAAPHTGPRWPWAGVLPALPRIPCGASSTSVHTEGVLGWCRLGSF